MPFVTCSGSTSRSTRCCRSTTPTRTASTTWRRMLSVSPTLLDRYLAAARKLSRLALGIPPVGPMTDTYKAPSCSIRTAGRAKQLAVGIARRLCRPALLSGRRRLHHQGSPAAAALRLHRRARFAAPARGARGRRARDVVDRRRRGDVKAPPASFVGEVFGDPAWEKYALRRRRGLGVRFRASAGPRIVGVAFLSRQTGPRTACSRPGIRRASGRTRRDARRQPIDRQRGDRRAALGRGPGDTPSRRTILSCPPAAAAEEPACARQILSSIARRAYRRPVTETETAILLRFFEDGRKDGSFDTGLQFGIGTRSRGSELLVPGRAGSRRRRRRTPPTA